MYVLSENLKKKDRMFFNHHGLLLKKKSLYVAWAGFRYDRCHCAYLPSESDRAEQSTAYYMYFRYSTVDQEVQKNYTNT